jgi:hypothetical protein
VKPRQGNRGVVHDDAAIPNPDSEIAWSIVTDQANDGRAAHHGLHDGREEES